ncbi:MAG: hypothetical protein FWC95_07095 [Defluviitaleaceae bacterium]|nr:hypothetical protein [Defluviitaleaceae bacterium]
MSDNLNKLLTLAETGDAESQFEYGMKFIRNANKTNDPQGFHIGSVWLKRAADSGHVKAMKILWKLHMLCDDYPDSNLKEASLILSDLVYVYEDPESMIELGYYKCSGSIEFEGIIDVCEKEGLNMIDTGFHLLENDIDYQLCYRILPIYIKFWHKNDKGKYNIDRIKQGVLILDKLTSKHYEKVNEEFGTEFMSLCKKLLRDGNTILSINGIDKLTEEEVCNTQSNGVLKTKECKGTSIGITIGIIQLLMCVTYLVLYWGTDIFLPIQADTFADLFRELLPLGFLCLAIGFLALAFSRKPNTALLNPIVIIVTLCVAAIHVIEGTITVISGMFDFITILLSPLILAFVAIIIAIPMIPGAILMFISWIFVDNAKSLQNPKADTSNISEKHTAERKYTAEENREFLKRQLDRNPELKRELDKMKSDF